MKFEFRIGSIPVSVHGSFLLVLAFLGYGGGGGGLLHLAALVQWIVVAFIGVLLHEMGHALVGRSFGLTPQIELAGFGGLTSWTGGRTRLPPAKGIAISLAGPFTGIAIGLGTMVLVRARGGLSPFGLFDHDTPWTALTADIVYVNAGWGLLNLLPILPMDGGNVLLQGLRWLTKGGGEKAARVISCGAAALLALYAFSRGQTYAALLAGLFALQNFQALRAAAQSSGQTPQWPPRF